MPFITESPCPVKLYPKGHGKPASYGFCRDLLFLLPQSGEHSRNINYSAKKQLSGRDGTRWHRAFTRVCVRILRRCLCVSALHRTPYDAQRVLQIPHPQIIGSPAANIVTEDPTCVASEVDLVHLRWLGNQRASEALTCS